MGVNNDVNIGGVNFRKDNIKSSEVIERDGEQFNSVFLNDGTHIVYPDQDTSKNSTVVQYDLSDIYGNYMEYPKKFGFGHSMYMTLSEENKQHIKEITKG